MARNAFFKVSNGVLLASMTAFAWGGPKLEKTGTDLVLDLITPKTVFITSESYTGSLGGLEGADAICQLHADAAGLKGEYIAFLSTSTTNAVQRLTPTLGPYVLVDGSIVVKNFAELFATTPYGADLSTYQFLAQPIALDEWGDSHIFDAVWTGTSVNGVVADANCDDWMEGGVSGGGLVGRLADVEAGGPLGGKDRTWTEYKSDSCARPSALYCFQK